MQRFSPVLLPVQRLPPPATAFPTPGAGCCFNATPSQGRAGGGEAGCGRARLGLDLRKAGAASFPQENVPLADGSAYAGGREESRRLIKHPWSLKLGRGATKWLMPGARSKRCRQARPLTAGTRLAERERPGDGNAHQCRTPVALGAQRSVPAVKGGIARAPGWQKRGSGHVAWAQTVGRSHDHVNSRAWCKGSAFLNFHACDWCGTREQPHGRLLPAARCGRG